MAQRIGRSNPIAKRTASRDERLWMARMRMDDGSVSRLGVKVKDRDDRSDDERRTTDDKRRYCSHRFKRVLTWTRVVRTRLVNGGFSLVRESGREGHARESNGRLGSPFPVPLKSRMRRGRREGYGLHWVTKRADRCTIVVGRRGGGTLGSAPSQVNQVFHGLRSIVSVGGAFLDCSIGVLDQTIHRHR